MWKIIRFCVLCWVGGGLLTLSAICNKKPSHIRYIVDFKHGELVSRLLVGGFGLCVMGIGTLLWLAMG